MSNTRKLPCPGDRAPRPRPGRGRHRQPARTIGERIAVPGQAGAKLLAAGAIGSVAAIALPVVAGVTAASAATTPTASAGGVASVASALTPATGQSTTQTAPGGQTSTGVDQGSGFGNLIPTNLNIAPFINPAATPNPKNSDDPFAFSGQVGVGLPFNTDQGITGVNLFGLLNITIPQSDGETTGSLPLNFNLQNLFSPPAQSASPSLPAFTPDPLFPTNLPNAVASDPVLTGLANAFSPLSSAQLAAASDLVQNNTQFIDSINLNNGVSAVPFLGLTTQAQQAVEQTLPSPSLSSFEDLTGSAVGNPAVTVQVPSNPVIASLDPSISQIPSSFDTFKMIIDPATGLPQLVILPPTTPFNANPAPIVFGPGQSITLSDGTTVTPTTDPSVLGGVLITHPTSASTSPSDNPGLSTNGDVPIIPMTDVIHEIQEDTQPPSAPPAQQPPADPNAPTNPNEPPDTNPAVRFAANTVDPATGNPVTDDAGPQTGNSDGQTATTTAATPLPPAATNDPTTPTVTDPDQPTATTPAPAPPAPDTTTPAPAPAPAPPAPDTTSSTPPPPPPPPSQPPDVQPPPPPPPPPPMPVDPTGGGSSDS